MGYAIGSLIAVVVVGGAGLLMFRSFRRREQRDAVLAAYPVPTDLGDPRLDCEALYVATTPHGEPLERLAMPGLAFRGSARVEVVPEGLVLRIAGEPPSFLPADRLVGADRATWAIDRTVEPEGLVVVTWIPREAEPGDAPDDVHAPVVVDSYLRARYPGDSAAIIATVTDIAAAELPRPDADAEEASRTDIAADDAPRPATRESEASDD